MHPDEEIKSVLSFCHELACGGHFGPHKTAQIRKASCCLRKQLMNLFLSTFEHFMDLLAQSPHHGIEKWRICQALYDGLEYQTKTLLESMCQG